MLVEISSRAIRQSLYTRINNFSVQQKQSLKTKVCLLSLACDQLAPNRQTGQNRSIVPMTVIKT